MGDTWIPDRAITLEEILHCYILLEEDWSKFAEDRDMRLQTTLTAMMLVGGFSGGLRGEELPKLELGAIRRHWEEGIQHKTPHVPLVLAGRFKMSNGEKLFFLPLACRSTSGIDNRLWTHRLLEAYAALRVYSGPVFCMGGGNREKVKRSAMGDLDPCLHGILVRVQERWPRVLPPSIKVGDEFSVRRSLRRGSTTEASNRGIPKEVIEANQRWGKHQRSRGVLPSMSMMERYSDARANIEYLVRYSLGL
jgi:hypothetical protein